MYNQQGSTVEHRELCSMICGSLDGRGVWGRMDTWICMAESFCCSPETITTLLIGCIPIQNLKCWIKRYLFVLIFWLSVSLLTNYTWTPESIFILLVSPLKIHCRWMFIHDYKISGKIMFNYAVREESWFILQILI